jgi:hypothetical protein
MRIKRLNQKKKEIAGLIYFFALSACNPMKKEKEQKEKKRKVNWRQTKLHYHSHVTQEGRGY